MKDKKINKIIDHYYFKEGPFLCVVPLSQNKNHRKNILQKVFCDVPSPKLMECVFLIVNGCFVFTGFCKIDDFFPPTTNLIKYVGFV